MSTVTVSPDYRIEIPEDIRTKIDIQPGQQVHLMVLNHRMVVIPMKPIEDGYGFLPGLDTKLENEPDRDL
jgi:AbrB family looped-hinge helix DNA binding protein